MKTDKNMDAWARGVAGYCPKIGRAFGQSKEIGYINLDKFNLPRYKINTVKVQVFLKNPRTSIRGLDSKRFYITLFSENKRLERYGTYDISLRGITKFINEKIRTELMSEYKIIISEYFANRFGGSILIGRDGSLFAEFVRGNQTRLARGKKIPNFTVVRDKNTRIFHYSFTDQNFRKIFFDLIMKIPHTNEGREMEFIPGYFEVLLIKRDKDSKLEPIFIDYRDHPDFPTIG